MARRFNSYGPSETKAHFVCERRTLVERCVEQLVGLPEESGGHYFTIWGARQTGKTWLMRQAVAEVRKRFGDRFAIGVITLQSVVEGDEAKKPLTSFLEQVPDLLWEGFDVKIGEAPKNFAGFRQLLSKERAIFDRPMILLLDEFDSLPPKLIDRLVATFRKMYLARDRYWLHGLALIGVRAVLGVESPRGSPFNVQRSLYVPNLLQDEVVDLFGQYQSESGQVIEPDVVEAVYDCTRGQPGLVGWFGELVTEKYNPGKDKAIGMNDWRQVYGKAVYVEWNNTLLNLGKKARGPFRAQVMRLFTDPNVPFAMEEEWCSFLYMNGIIDHAPADKAEASEAEVCRFSCPFVQLRLYSGFTTEIFGYKGPLPAIPIGDALEDVFTQQGLCISRLLERYRDYLKRVKAAGIDPWQGQPRRQDLNYTEAVGHFHLYAWLQNALQGYSCSISPEFPTGNGKVDLVLRQHQHTAVIEVKSFVSMPQVEASRKQAAVYAKKLGLTAATVAMFAPTQDDAILAKLSSESNVDGVCVTVAALGWV